MARCRCWTGTLKNHTKCQLRWKPDSRPAFFFRPPAHLCAVTDITKILFNVTLSYQFNQPTKCQIVQRNIHSKRKGRGGTLSHDITHIQQSKLQLKDTIKAFNCCKLRPIISNSIVLEDIYFECSLRKRHATSIVPILKMLICYNWLCMYKQIMHFELNT